MKASKYLKQWVTGVLGLLTLLVAPAIAPGQEIDTTAAATAAQKPAKKKPVKNTFESIWIIDNQTVMVPAKRTFEIDIMHRFGTMKNLYKDFYGMFAPSNIRFGVSYVLRNDLMIGASLTKENMMWEGFVKYAIIKQTKDVYPVSVTYYGNLGIRTEEDEYRYFSDRISSFQQLIIARKITDKLSLQVAPGHSHVNVVNGLYKYDHYKNTSGDDSTVSSIIGTMKHDHFSLAVSGRYKLKESMAILLNYDQPLTKHRTNNPNPNFAFGIEVSTSAHAFQFFFGNYYYITPQWNNLYNKNDPGVAFRDKYKQYLIGFNITRLWSY